MQSQNMGSSKISKNDRMTFLSLWLLTLSIQASFLETTAQQVIFIVVSQKETSKQSTPSQISGCFPFVINVNRVLQQEEEYSDKKKLSSLQSSYPIRNPKTIMERTWYVVFELSQQQQKNAPYFEERAEIGLQLGDS